MLLIDNLLLSNNYFGQNMHKNVLFLLKNCKNRQVLVFRPSFLQRLGAFPPDPLVENSWLRHCFKRSENFGLLE